MIAAVQLMALPALGAACSLQDATSIDAPSSATTRTAAEMALQADDRVDLALYFRSGSGQGAHLVRVVREVAVADDLPRQAVELLLQGPGEQDGSDLVAPLPPGTRLLDLQVRDGMVTVDLSREVITRAPEVGAQPHNELLALAALADTVTEFPAIESVSLTVEGRQLGQLDDDVDVGAFWGGWGLPARMVRDEQVIGPPSDGLGVPDLARFNRARQDIDGDRTAAVSVRSVRVRDHTAYSRLVIELGDGNNPELATAAPRASVRVGRDGIVLRIEQVADHPPVAELDQILEAGHPLFDAITAESKAGGETLVFTLVTAGAPEYWLHTQTSPTRVILDVREQQRRSAHD